MGGLPMKLFVPIIIIIIIIIIFIIITVVQMPFLTRNIYHIYGTECAVEMKGSSINCLRYTGTIVCRLELATRE